MQSAGADRSKDHGEVGEVTVETKTEAKTETKVEPKTETKAAASAAVVYAMLPLVSELPDTKHVQQAIELLTELDAIQQLIEAHKERQEELKTELAGFQKLAGGPGLRWGDLCFVDRVMPGRETLDKVKLMEVAGVTAAQLKECTKVGKPYEQRTFKNLSRKSSDE